MSRLNQVILEQIKIHAKQLGAIIGLMMVSSAIQVISPWPFKILIDNVLGSELVDISTPLGSLLNRFESPQSLGVFVIVVYFVISIASNIADYIQSHYTNRVIRRIIQNFSTSAFKNLESFDIGYYQQQDVGDYTYRLSYDASTIGSLIEFGGMPIITSSVYLIFTSAILYSMDPRLTIITLLALPVLAFGLQFFNKQITIASQESETRYTTLHSFIQQSLSQLKIIQAYRQESNLLTRYKQQITSSLDADFKLNRLNLLMSLFMGVLVTIIYTAVIGLGIDSVFAGNMSAGLLIVFIFYLDNLTQPVITIANAVSSIKEDVVKLNRLEEFFDSQHQLMDSGNITEVTDTTIKFIQVSVIGAQKEVILSDINCEFPEKTLTYVIGLSGSGKSSLTSLILRLMNQLDYGDIMMGPYSIRDYKLETLRQTIALVPQETVLFNDTIRNIIAFGNPEATFEEVKAAAKLAVADEFIDRHPGNYAFKVGERGELLSGGQRQRLSLARAFLKRAPVMILDEVFAHQDPETRSALLKNLQDYSVGRTVLAVTNNFEIVRPFDRVLVLHRGHIVYQGNYEMLKAAKVFSAITNWQSSGEGVIQSNGSNQE